MSKPFELVVFDWEGTLSDTLGQFIQAFAVEAKRLELGEVDLELARHYIALGPVIAIKKLFPHLATHQQSDLLQSVQNSLITNPTEICLTPGALDVLQKMKQAGIQMAVASNRGQQSLLRDIEASGLGDFFTTTRSASQAPPKPCPQMLEEIMSVCGVTAFETLMIGDSASDIEMANQLHVVAIGVDFYFQNESILRAAGAENVFNDFQQLTRYLNLA
jgi:phosphoglycolate phosphatase